jgi:hypothetical protein
MREITFVQRPGIGPGVSPPRTGSTADLVMSLPYVVMREIPPRRVLNDVLARGFLDAGMSGGCIWEPFQIEEPEFAELVRELQRRGTRPVQGPEGVDPGGDPFDVPLVPEHVQTYEDWSAYRIERRLGKPPPRRDRLGDPEGRLPEARYRKWLDWLPVADLYIAKITSTQEPGWYPRLDVLDDLSDDFVALLREYKLSRDKWFGHRVEDIPRLGEEWERDREDIDEYVAREGLPRWPFAPDQPIR